MSRKQKVKFAFRRWLISGSVTGFAAFDPDEKDHVLELVKCDVIMKDSMGEVVAKVPTSHPFAIRKSKCVECLDVQSRRNGSA